MYTVLSDTKSLKTEQRGKNHGETQETPKTQKQKTVPKDLGHP